MQAVKTVYAKARDKNITITFDCGQTFEAVNKQNGYIKVASDEKGTTFSLFLKKV